MNQAMLTAAAGMIAEHDKIENIENDMASFDVVGYKKTDLRFHAITDHGRVIGPDTTDRTLNFAQGRIMKSNGPFDMAIEGQGLFRIVKNGDVLFTRDGEFHRDADTGLLMNRDGYHLEGVRIPKNAINAHADPQGRVYADIPTKKNVYCGRIMLAVFPAPEFLHQVSGGNMFTTTKNSGTPQLVEPNGDTDGAGKITYGFVERANQGIIQSMMEVLGAQRYFETNSKGMQAADEMLRIANGLIR